MAKREDQKTISVILEQDTYEKLVEISKTECKSKSKICKEILTYLIDNPHIIAELRFRMAQTNLSDNYKQYTKFYHYGDEDVDKLIEEIRNNLNTINNPNPD